jgi:uncharacterized protein YndB with AHSA1/START domain
MADRESAIRWPAEYAPEGAPLHAVNELRMSAPRERVFAWLSRPDLWPSFYGNAWRVRHLEGPWPEVKLGSKFRWITFGAMITSEIVEYEPPDRLAWDAHAPGSHGYHGWAIQKWPDGCYVVTEETQRGWGINIARFGLKPLMVRYHQKWLEGLARVAAEGDPPPPKS